MKNSSKLVFSFCNRFVSEYLPGNQYSENTVASYRDALLLLMRFAAFKGFDVDCFYFSDITEDFVLDFRIWIMEERNCSAETANHRFSLIRNYVKYCRKDDAEITSLWLMLCDIPQLKGEAKVPEEALTEEQVELLFRQPLNYGKDLRDRTLMILLYETAARISEVTLLTLGQLECLNGKTPSVVFHGKGNKYRRIPLTENVTAHLHRYLKYFHPDGGKPDDYLFYTEIHHKRNPISSSDVTKFMNKYAAMARKTDPDFPEHIHSHLFRSSKCTHLADSGVGVHTASRYLGHSSVETTMKYYYKPNKEKMRQAIESASRQHNLPQEKKDEYELLKLRMLGLK